MIKPLQDSFIQGYRHGQKTFYSDKHLGIDWICRKGLAIYSPEDGKIINLYSGQGGNTIVLRSKDYTHRFMHLSRFNAKLNDNVKARQVIGYTGNTGMSTAPHLHWDVSKGNLQLNNFNNFVDPLSFKFTNNQSNKPMKFEGEAYITRLCENYEILLAYPGLFLSHKYKFVDGDFNWNGGVGGFRNFVKWWAENRSKEEFKEAVEADYQTWLKLQ